MQNAAPTSVAHRLMLGVGHAVEPEVSDQGLGDEPEALRPAGKRRDHRQGGEREVRPAVVDPTALHEGRSLAR